MTHSNVYVDENVRDFAIKSHLMKEYHLSFNEIDDLPSHYIYFLIKKDEELGKIKQNKIKQQEKKLKKLVSGNKL